MTTQSYRTSNPYESLFGYNRGVRRGNTISIAGTTSISPTTGEVQHKGSAYLQARASLEEAERGVITLGGSTEDVVRVRWFVRHGKDCGEVGGAMREWSGKGGPFVATMIVVTGFVDEDILVECLRGILGMFGDGEAFLRGTPMGWHVQL